MAKLRNKLSYLLALIAPIFSLTTYADDEPKSAGSDKEAMENASGSLSAGAIAAAVAAAAVVAAALDSGDGGGAAVPAPTAAPTPAPTAAPTPAPTAAPTPAPTAAPTPAPTEVYEYLVDTTVASATSSSSNTTSEFASSTSTNSATYTNVASATAVNSATNSNTSTTTITLTDSDPSDGIQNEVTSETLITLDAYPQIVQDVVDVTVDELIEIQVEIDTIVDLATVVDIDTTVDVTSAVTATATR